ncbi:AI-2E family transporter [Arthrobacter sp. 35/47]|uniref:AI-2E family transporter n=1 Tax=Arthrobacter sp. 35/47 TaxID=269454 RepID=UPI0004B864D7|nr:AI-2E family transporter [Arthrobacter sp. 35/47]
MEYRDDTSAAQYRSSPWKDGLGRASIRSAQLLLLIAALVVSVYGLIQVRLVVIPLLLALILAAAISPLVNMLRRNGWPGALATAFAFFLLLGVLGGVVTGIVFAVRGQFDELVSSANEGFDQVYDFIRTGPLPVDEAQIQEARQALVDFATSATAGSTALSGLTAAGTFITGALLMAVILFFFLKDGDRIWAFMLRGFKGERLRKARQVGFRSLEVLGGYVRGTAIIALVDSIFIGLALFILGVPLALPLAVIVFVGAFVPLVGATVAGALAALVALVANGPFVALMVILAVVVVNQLEGNFLQPVVMGRSLSIHPLVILLALTAGTILAGIIGAILSVPVAAVAWAAIKVWTGEDNPDLDAEPGSGSVDAHEADAREADAREADARGAADSDAAEADSNVGKQ